MATELWFVPAPNIAPVETDISYVRIFSEVFGVYNILLVSLQSYFTWTLMEAWTECYVARFTHTEEQFVLFGFRSQIVEEKCLYSYRLSAMKSQQKYLHSLVKEVQSLAHFLLPFYQLIGAGTFSIGRNFAQLDLIKEAHIGNNHHPKPAQRWTTLIGR